MQRFFITWNRIENIKDFSNEYIEKQFSNRKQIKYFYIKHYKETTEHYHIAGYDRNGITFEQLQKKFPTAHIEELKGTFQEAYDYMQHKNTNKLKYEKTEIKGNKIEDFQIETNNEDKELIEMIYNGARYIDILRKYPKYWYRIDKIKTLKEILTIEELEEHMGE